MNVDQNNIFLGIDLGTSGMKMLAVNGKGEIVAETNREYPLMFPKEGWSEQDPALWWEAVCDGLPELLSGLDRAKVKGIGLGGQMHGLVSLDENFQVIRPAILWNDGRTGKEVEYLNEVIGTQNLAKYTANIAFAGFTAPKILWMKNNEPENFQRLKKICLPKDYLNYLLTGIHCTDVSDAAGMLLMDVEKRCWSKEMLEICGISEEMMPKIYESYETVGKLKKELAQQFGLSEEVIVCAGAGDNAAAAVGTGTVQDGDCNISMGTSGTIFISMDQFSPFPNNALHNFAHANGGYHLMGCILSAASCNKWLCENILKTEDYASEQKEITLEKLGQNKVFYLPYLMGERSPLNDVHARSCFIGMNMATTRSEMVQAVLEGVCFAIRDSFEIAKAIGLKIDRTKMCGGGAKSKLWCTMMANVLGIPVDLPKTEQGPGYGGAILAMVACGLYKDVKSAAALVEVKETILPDPEIVKRYDRRYAQFSLLYPALKDAFAQIDQDE